MVEPGSEFWQLDARAALTQDAALTLLALWLPIHSVNMYFLSTRCVPSNGSRCQEHFKEEIGIKIPVLIVLTF